MTINTMAVKDSRPYRTMVSKGYESRWTGSGAESCIQPMKFCDTELDHENGLDWFNRPNN